jgi:hypothetical protein
MSTDMESRQQLSAASNLFSVTLPMSRWLAHHWIQITKQESIECENKGLVPRNSGYHYSLDTGIDMLEYHVDSCSEFQVRMNEETEFGGQPSVRKEEHE